MKPLAVLGPGGVGGFLAGALARAGADVVVIAREPTAGLIAREGLRVSSVRLGDFEARPRVAEVLEEPTQALFVTSKAPALAASLERIATDPGLVVPLLNGRDHLELLRARLRAPVAAGSIRIEATRVAPGVIEHTSPFLRVDLGADDPAVAALLPAVVERLEAADVPAQVLESEAQVVWSKLVRLNALACTTSAADAPLGEVRDDPRWHALLEQAVREGVEVARAEGAHMDFDTTMAELVDAHAQLRSSMQRDIEAGRRTELDAIAGAVIRAARSHGIEVPGIERLARLVAERAGEPLPF